MVHEILSHGADNAISGKQLASALDLEHRELTKQIERERQAGEPICAAVSGDDRGYYLAADAGELALYLRSLDRRIKSVQKTRRALESTLSTMTGQTELDGWGDGFE